MADACEARDRFEAYLVRRIASGEGLYGVYPPNDQTKADYQAWLKAGANEADITTIRAASHG